MKQANMTKAGFKKSLIVLAMVASVSTTFTPAYAAGIPVIDAANLVNTLENIEKWKLQLTAMKDQFDQQVKQYTSLTGNRGFGTLLNDPALKKYLPDDWKNVYNQVLSPALEHPAICVGFAGVEFTRCETQAKKHYQDQMGYENAYNTSVALQNQVQGLIDGISTTTDPKDIAELQARIAGEQTKVLNAMMQMQLSTQLAEIKNKLVIQQQKEANYAATKARIGVAGTYPTPITDWH
ncbi:P-type DNA transfer protein VirB5 [Methylotenera sp.]|uniref:P-type DNA transfer protein VirB5 n=1 Tax=Methylotenera sp. TaxID=2051956 RepID=UPI002726CAFA|nr:P-type DNA transfer protein VirB5 [Methylotenera sp.]MDO9204392.1 P-type DNA transfer protein VirB5 [Methylotenera sp.]MDP1523363.1 P-type DNA transfer protein VirB5 [Methylotenera sp.]MDP1658329.1 P-type DNA transfer protein VirB5 [Methylotenera sp.]MDP3819507.1 P-type DNA transfer protein VirB5 [Methylotenera sp.]